MNIRKLSVQSFHITLDQLPHRVSGMQLHKSLWFVGVTYSCISFLNKSLLRTKVMRFTLLQIEKEDDPMFPHLFNLNIYCHPNRIKAYQHIVFVLHHFQLVLLFGECIHCFGQVYFKLLQYLRGEKKDIRWI